MKILIAHNAYLQRGGEDFVFEQEVKLLESRGHEVFILKEDNARIRDMSTADLVSATIWNHRAYDLTSELIVRNQIEVMHIHNFFPLLSPSIFKAADSKGVAIVFTAHNFRLLCLNALLLRDGKDCHDCVRAGNFIPGIIHRCYRDSLSASAISAISLSFHKVAQTITATTDRIIALNPDAAEELARGGIDKSIIHIRRNSVFSYDSAGAGSGNYVCYAGRLAPEKGIETMIEAWLSMYNVIPLRVAGGGPLEHEIEDLCKSCPDVKYDGWLQEADLLDRLGEARLLIFPTLCKETCPIIVLQSLACGTPVLISDNCSMAQEIVASGSGSTFKSGNPTSLAQMARALFDDDKKLASMREAARNFFLRNFSAGTSYDSLMQVYREAIQHRMNRNGL